METDEHEEESYACSGSLLRRDVLKRQGMAILLCRVCARLGQILNLRGTLDTRDH